MKVHHSGELDELSVGGRRPDQRRGCQHQRPVALLAGHQRGLCTFALGDFLGRNVDAENVAARVLQRIPVRQPAPVGADSIRALSADLDVRHRLALGDDGLHELLHLAGDIRHHFADGVAEMILHRNSAYVGQALVDLKVAAIG